MGLIILIKKKKIANFIKEIVVQCCTESEHCTNKTKR